MKGKFKMDFKGITNSDFVGFAAQRASRVTVKWFQNNNNELDFRKGESAPLIILYLTHQILLHTIYNINTRKSRWFCIYLVTWQESWNVPQYAAVPVTTPKLILFLYQCSRVRVTGLHAFLFNISIFSPLVCLSLSLLVWMRGEHVVEIGGLCSCQSHNAAIENYSRRMSHCSNLQPRRKENEREGRLQTSVKAWKTSERHF